MKSIDINRRKFMKKAGGSLIAAAVGSSLTLSTVQAHALQSAVTQTKQTQSAITPLKALQMLKEGNTRFVQRKMLKRDLMLQLNVTAGGQFPLAAIVGCIDVHRTLLLQPMFDLQSLPPLLLSLYRRVS